MGTIYVTYDDEKLIKSLCDQFHLPPKVVITHALALIEKEKLDLKRYISEAIARDVK